MAQTNRSDVVSNFYRYQGRNPNQNEEATIQYLMTKAPSEVEKLLAKDSPITRGLTWSEYQANQSKSSATQIDPYKIAAKYGFTAQDFANDKNFESYWKNKSEAELKEALTSKRDDFDPTSGRKRTESEQAQYRNAMDSIDNNPNCDSTQKAILKQAYNSADINTVYGEEDYKKLAADSEAEARTDLDPYYKDVERRDMEDLKTSYADIRNEAARFSQQEAKSYKETLAATKQGLRARGLTFSGRSRGVLGKEGALNDKDVEGELPQQRRYDYKDASAGWQEKARDIGTLAERKYGSDKLYAQRDFLDPEGLNNPYGGGLDYDPNKKQPIYLPHKADAKEGYVKRTQADIEKERELEVQKRTQDRLNTYKYI